MLAGGPDAAGLWQNGAMPATIRPRILLLSAYDAGSHRRWREQLVATQPEFDWQVLTLAPRYFRWRIRGNALSWLDEPLLQQRWDALVVTSMVDLVSIRGFHRHLAATPALLYMHENQFAYPDSDQQHASADPKVVNLYSALAADQVVFNSAWNRDSFLQQAGAFLRRLPDGVPSGIIERIRDRSSVIPVPIEDRLFVARRQSGVPAVPHLLWNHRWEYDKGPERLLALLDALADAGQDFRLSVVGEQFRSQPAAFRTIHQRYQSRLLNWGYLASRADYDRLLAAADVVVSTAVHDFQGLAMLEAMASGCLALAPRRLAYPEYVPAGQLYASFPDDPQAEAGAAADLLISMLHKPPCRSSPDDWRLSRLQRRYHAALDALIGG